MYYTMVLAVLTWQPLAALDCSDRQVLLCDAFRFGCTPEHAAEQTRLAYSNQVMMRCEVKAWNTAEVFLQWERECNWRYGCWSMLAVALNCEWAYHRHNRPPFSPQRQIRERLQALNTLRAMIGDDAFFGGVMPSPFPEYKR